MKPRSVWLIQSVKNLLSSKVMTRNRESKIISMSGEANHGLRMWRAKERRYMALDHSGITYQSNDEASAGDAYERTSLIEVGFKAKDLNLVNGGFTGVISLLDPEGEVKAEKLTGVIDPKFVNESSDSWEQEHERLYIYIPEKAEAGDSISINGGEEMEQRSNSSALQRDSNRIGWITQREMIISS